MDLITLIGDIDENFYQLGLKDKELGRSVHLDIKDMLRTPWPAVNRILEEVGKTVLKNSLLKKTEYFHHVRHYAEGMGIPLDEFVYTMIIPELVSGMSKWAPGLVKGHFGCSSFMFRNAEGSVSHGRILDFPLQGSYDRYERAIFYDLKDFPKTLGFGTSGMPYPSITLMTEEGLTLALHQKFTNVLNPMGMPIFEYIFQLIKNARDLPSIIDFVKTHQTITTWCLYITHKEGEALAIDVGGERSFISELRIPETGILYFCNHLEDKSLKQRDFLPLGFDQYNLMREKIAAQKISNFLDKKNKQPTDLELLQLMTTPLPQKLKANQMRDYALDNITPSSISAMVLNPTEKKALYLGGMAPKVFRDEVIEFTSSFTRPLKAPVKIKKNSAVDPEYHLGLQCMMKAQKGFDTHNSLDIYHHLQMAIDHLEHYPEKNIAHFYFLIARYLYEKHPQVLPHLLTDFKKCEGHLPPYLNDHCLMFIGRLEHILKIKSSFELPQIETLKLRQIYQRELKIPRQFFHLASRKMIIPRIDILDVIYLLTT